MKKLYFITHPNVQIDPAVPVPQWPLSPKGMARMQSMLKQPWVNTLTALYTSTEQKAVDGGTVLSRHLQLPITQVEALGENDRSATGFLPSAEFEAVADQFFAHPHQSVRGWETAAAAQHRIVTAVQTLTESDTSSGNIAIVAHGAVGALLLCHVAGYPISRQHDQPPTSGGNYYTFYPESGQLLHAWRPIDPQ